MNPEEIEVTYTVMEDEYRDAIEKHGEDVAFKELEHLYQYEKNRRSDSE